jgi:hypothetical protein
MIYEKNKPSFWVFVAITESGKDKFDDTRIGLCDFGEEDICLDDFERIEVGPFFSRKDAEEMELAVLKEIKRGYESG